jgi:hypothetical protein
MKFVGKISCMSKERYHIEIPKESIKEIKGLLGQNVKITVEEIKL